MEDNYMSGEGLCRKEDKASKCRTVRRNAGRMATLAQWRCKSIRVSTYFLRLFYSFLIFSLLESHIWQLNLDQNVPKKILKKQKAKCLYVHICYFSEVEIAMTRNGKLCFDCL